MIGREYSVLGQSFGSRPVNIVALYMLFYYKMGIIIVIIVMMEIMIADIIIGIIIMKMIILVIIIMEIIITEISQTHLTLIRWRRVYMISIVSRSRYWQGA